MKVLNFEKKKQIYTFCMTAICNSIPNRLFRCPFGQYLILMVKLDAFTLILALKYIRIYRFTWWIPICDRRGGCLCSRFFKKPRGFFFCFLLEMVMEMLEKWSWFQFPCYYSNVGITRKSFLTLTILSQQIHLQFGENNEEENV